MSIVLSTPRGAIIPEDFALEAVSGEVEQQQLDLNITSYTYVTTDAGSTLDTSVVVNALARFRNVK